MNNKGIIVLIVIIIIIGGGIYFLNTGTVNVPSSTSQSEIDQPPAETPVSTSMPIPSSTPVLDKLVTHNISIQNFAFSQSSITVKKGDIVVWTNKDSAPHTITGENGGPNSETLSQSGTYSFTFNNAGTFSYHCKFHPSMTGIVIVLN